jgi:hypothetical protein
MKKIRRALRGLYYTILYAYTDWKDNLYPVWFELCSTQFHVAQPDLAHEFSGLEDMAEDSANCGDKDEYRRENGGHYEVDHVKLKAKIAEIWMQMFTALWVKQDSKTKIIQTALWSPRDYYHGGDGVDFKLRMSWRTFKRFCAHLKWRADEWDAFLRSEYCHRPGFWSFMPHNIEMWNEGLKIKKNRKEFYHKAVVAIIQGVLWRDDRDTWRKELHAKVWGDFDFDDCLNFVPMTECMEVDA